ncbi:MAG TPA: orotidine-5'-phosphate decarboxylase, partial [candidate division Zixibacteria bacterium]|nr:orotidine-5'-phosphate decarboxylase [candidate division Zixibacteria bacterium]
QTKNNSLLCIGLDIDPRRAPNEYNSNPKGLFDFARAIIEATKDLVAAYKPNLAFFEAMGADGWSLLRTICDRIPEEITIILDAKRADIGNTSAQYAAALFKQFRADWVTVNPYMGHDSIRPFLDYKDRGVFVLCLTSNPGSVDFQMLESDGKPLYMHVCEKARQWNSNENVGLVVGATHPDHLAAIRERAADMPLLIPGIGAQGGALERAVMDGTANFTRPALLNVSRSVLYASDGPDFAEKARESAERTLKQINALRPTNRAEGAGQPQAVGDTPGGES